MYIPLKQRETLINANRKYVAVGIRSLKLPPLSILRIQSWKIMPKLGALVGTQKTAATARRRRERKEVEGVAVEREGERGAQLEAP